MPRKKDNLTKTIHLRVSEATWNSFEQISLILGLPFPDTCRLALQIFIMLWQKLSGANFLKRWILGFVENKND